MKTEKEFSTYVADIQNFQQQLSGGISAIVDVSEFLDYFVAFINALSSTCFGLNYMTESMAKKLISIDHLYSLIEKAGSVSYVRHSLLAFYYNVHLLVEKQSASFQALHKEIISKIVAEILAFENRGKQNFVQVNTY